MIAFLTIKILTCYLVRPKYFSKIQTGILSTLGSLSGLQSHWLTFCQWILQYSTMWDIFKWWNCVTWLPGACGLFTWDISYHTLLKELQKKKAPVPRNQSVRLLKREENTSSPPPSVLWVCWGLIQQMGFGHIYNAGHWTTSEIKEKGGRNKKVFRYLWS